MKLVPVRWFTRRCRGCNDGSPHSHHLTWLGRWRYTRHGTRVASHPPTQGRKGDL